MIEKYAEPFTIKFILRPMSSIVVKFFSNNPNLYTFLAAILGLLGVIAIYYSCLWCGVLSFIASGLCDMLDGYIARLVNKTSNVGAVMDILVDRFVEFAIIFSIYLVDPAQNALYCILMLGSILLCITSFLVVGIFTKNMSSKSFYYSPGLVERPEAFIFFILMLCSPKYVPEFSLVFVILVILTTIIRVQQFVKQSIAS